VLNQFLTGHPLEVIDDLLACASTQLNIPSHDIQLYATWQKTVFKHLERIRAYLDLRPFNNAPPAIRRQRGITALRCRVAVAAHAARRLPPADQAHQAGAELELWTTEYP
jgi:hypothetical protein